MKREAILWGLGILSTCFFFLWSLHLEKSERESFEKMEMRFHHFTHEKLQAENDQRFLETHKDLLITLKNKSWFTPPHRLLAYDILKDVGKNLPYLHVTFEPETMIKLGDTREGRRTTIVLTCKAALDTDIYTFFQTLLETFPGILISRSIILKRIPSTPESLEPHSASSISAKLILDWITSGKAYDFP